MVLIGGAARSGKSSFSSALAIALRKSGRSVSIVSLDNWLRDASSRGEGVLGRYDMAAAHHAVAELMERGGPIVCPAYDPVTRSSVADHMVISADPDAVKIIEGVPALLSEALRERARLKLFIENPEAQRFDRFSQEYAWRGESEAAIRSLYDARRVDEMSLVQSSSAFADRRIFLG
jgi:uridine kinase